ncbi:unnamed protein product [Caenorhabditis bovis]|uniref:aralkylamine N-acetyltransferase n=1 Tax=Caenorhabditis bovis TaxID=2654633 RepID=A0A8S1ECB7_9PELO|nr:unnamed protein product [Caenorhabditis bovis]
MGSTINDWYRIEPLTQQNGAEISRFLVKHFLVEEPLNRASGMTVKNFMPFVENLILRTLNVPFSYAARSNETNEIIGCSMSSLWRKCEHSEPPTDDFSFGGRENPSIGAVGRILTNLHERLFLIKPELDTVVHLEILSVAKEFQRKGVASALMNRQENADMLKRYWASGIAAEVSSYANQCLMKKRGYESLDEILLSNEVDINGKRLLECDDGTDRVVLAYKHLV